VQSVDGGPRDVELPQGVGVFAFQPVPGGCVELGDAFWRQVASEIGSLDQQRCWLRGDGGVVAIRRDRVGAPRSRILFSEVVEVLRDGAKLVAVLLGDDNQPTGSSGDRVGKAAGE